jgi:pyridoxamine 5'-phosphate oxidase
MNKKEIMAFITENPTCFLATAENKEPHVRAIGTYKADDNGIIFSMQSYKNVYKQIVKNPVIEACYWAKGTQLRVHGRVEPVTDIALRKEIIEKRPFLKAGVEKEGLDYAGAFILKHGKAAVMDPKAPAGALPTWVDF